MSFAANVSFCAASPTSRLVHGNAAPASSAASALPPAVSGPVVRRGRAVACRASSENAQQPTTQRKKTFSEVMGFSGYAPEVINGRLAQLGFVAGLGAEIATGESFPAQFAAHWPSFLFATGVVTLATFIPSFNSVTYTADPKTKKEVFGPFNEGAELFNSRAAMIGIAAMLAIESVKGGPLITLNAKPAPIEAPELTAAAIRQQAIEQSRNDGFEPRSTFTAPSAAPEQSFNPRADPLPAEQPPAAAPLASSAVDAAPEAVAPVQAEPLTQAQQIEKLQADVDALREEIKAMNRADPSLASTVY